jgi:GLPGLI family protein
MKKIILILFIISKFTLNSQNLSFEVIYSQGIKNPKITKSKEVKFFKGVEYKLLGNYKEAEFKLINKIIDESYIRNRRYIAKVGGEGIYYSNIKNKEKVHNFYVSSINENINIKEPFIKNWKLLKEERKIANYNCKKAVYFKKIKFKGIKETISIKYTVWFTLELPFSFGPFNLNGLPGLILAVEFENNYFIATNIKIKNINKFSLTKPIGKELTFEEFYDYLGKKTGVNFTKMLKKSKKTN